MAPGRAIPLYCGLPAWNIATQAEAKVVYLDNGTKRILRGVIVEEYRDFIRLERRDGRVRIAKRVVLRVETWRVDRNDNEWSKG